MNEDDVKGGLYVNKEVMQHEEVPDVEGLWMGVKLK